MPVTGVAQNYNPFQNFNAFMTIFVNHFCDICI